MADTARVLLWGSDIGAVTWLSDRAIGVFQYTPEFANSGIQVAPLVMPLRAAPYEFPTLSNDTFYRLPGMLPSAQSPIPILSCDKALATSTRPE